MAPPLGSGTVPARASQILAQAGEELAFVEAGKDTGLLPINSLVMDLEELPRENASEPFLAGLAEIRRFLDQVLDGEGVFSEEGIRFLNRWHASMSSVLADWGQGVRPSGAGIQAGMAGAPPTQAEVAAAPRSGAEEPAIRLSLAEDGELLREFHSESLELLQTIEQGVLALEENPTDAATINSVFRAFHTFKGSAGLLNLGALRDLAHDLESLLDGARRGELRITAGVTEVILKGADALKQYTSEIGAQLQGAQPGAAIVVPTGKLRQRVQAAIEGRLSETAPVGGPEVAQEGASPNPLERAPAGAGSHPAATGAAEGAIKGESATGFVKLDTRKLDSLVDLVGELVIAQSMVVQDPDVQRLPSRSLARSLRHLARITTDLQRTAMSMRMVPIGRAFQRMTRLVRDLSLQQRKEVQLVLEGEDTELDRNIVEELSDPLVHMIRNAVDHAMETPAERTAQGKPALGTIRLSAAHQRGGIVIDVQDDGKGLDRDRILAKARERGLVKADATLSEAEIFALIFAPGFSTAEVVTDVSGRGVGMDVVRRNIEKLRGKVEIQTVPGKGTTFTIVLPLTLAIIDGMLVGVGDDRYIIPTLSVRESFRPRAGMVSTVHEQGEVVSVRGRLTPLLRLGQHLGTPGRAADPTEGIIVVVESGDAARGLLVDELLGKQEVVIKNLGRTFRHQELLAGAAILGDGRVGLILDVDTLVRCRPANGPTAAGPLK